jgi:membrane protein implicated in regulation of membrane protease activity
MRIVKVIGYVILVGVVVGVVFALLWLLFQWLGLELWTYLLAIALSIMALWPLQKVVDTVRDKTSISQEKRLEGLPGGGREKRAEKRRDRVKRLYMAGLKQQEIADRLGVGLRTVVRDIKHLREQEEVQ